VSAIYGLYSTPEAAQRAVSSLSAAGVDRDRIIVMSGEPYEEQEFARRDSATWLWYIAFAGGVAGLVLSTWLTRMTELAWPLPTGNMPIVAWWPNLIVMFELTMLGAIVVPTLYDPEVTNGRILVGVDGARDAAAVERALAGGEIRRL